MSVRPPCVLPRSLVHAVTLAASAALFASGCGEIGQLVDLETAHNEAVYVPIEVAGTLALGVVRAQDYGLYSSVVHQSYSSGQPITEDGCIGIALLDGIEADGEGAVRYDFNGCSSQAGAVRVAQSVELPTLDDEARDELPEDWTDSDGDGIPDDLPEGAGDLDPSDLLSGDTLRDLLSTGADVEVVYDAYSEGLLSMEGSLGLRGGVQGEEAGGELDADLAVSFLDYSGELDAEGSWRLGDSEAGQRLSFTGDFISSTGLTWTVITDHVELVAGCMDGIGGQMTAIFENPLGTVEVTARFDDECDGCAAVVVDGVEQGEVCFPLDTFSNEGEEGPAM